MKSYRYLARFIALLVVFTLALSISSVLVAGQEATPGSDPAAPQADPKVYLPLVQKNPNTINGRVTVNGVAAPNVGLELHLYNAGAWNHIMSTTTNAIGNYFFAGMNSLLPGQKYKVTYENLVGDETRLWTWETRELTSYTSGDTVNIGNFDIANLELGTPAHLSLVTLPRIFYWTARPASPTDSYVFELFDYNDNIPSFSSVPLSYAAGYNLTSLPAGFLNCITYAWGLTIYGPDGGWGLPYLYNAVTFYTAAPSGIHGCVAESGVPKSGILVELHRLNINPPYDDTRVGAAKYTNPSGYFTFTDIPALDATHWYYVKYPNDEDLSTHLWHWYTRHLETYAAGSSVHIGDFDIANISLFLPTDGATVNLPETFSWTPRPFLQADSYEFDLFEPCDNCPVWYTDPPLGYVGQYNLLSLPPGFSTGNEYRWEIWVYSPYDSGYGFSYEARPVTFSASALSAAPTEILAKDQRDDLGLQRMLRNQQTRHADQPGLHPNFERPEVNR